ncbi:MAG: phenylacetate--CoA ligase family protein, partial [Comamonadaceae bacterium]
MTANAPADGVFHAVEKRPWAETEALQLAQLRVQLGYLAERSAFYQGKFRAAGITLDAIRTRADLQRIPFTTKQELRDSLQAQPPLGMHRAARTQDIVQVQASSGTTGSPAYVGLTAADRESWAEMTARGLFAGGIRPGDTVLHAFSMSKGFVGGIPIWQGIERIGAVDLPIGA